MTGVLIGGMMIGLAAGIIVGFIAGICAADQYWKRHTEHIYGHKYDNDLDYEIEPDFYKGDKKDE